MTIVIAQAKILTALTDSTVGTRVHNPAAFSPILLAAVAGFNFAAAREPGQGTIPLPPEANATVLGGVGPRSTDPSDYLIREWRGSVGLYLRRSLAAPVESVTAIVYTRDAYLSDPQVAADAGEVDRIKMIGATHVLVAILAAAGPRPPLSPGRFVSNLAGGNKEALRWTADEIRAKAAEIVAYDAAWAVVAD